MARLTGLLGVVCRNCDAYNEPSSAVCVGCGEPLRAGAPAAAPSSPAASSAPAGAAPGAATPAASELAGQASSPQAAPPRVLSFGREQASASSPANGRSSLAARLVVERGEAAPGSVFRIHGDEVQAGRAQGEILFPDDPCLAPLHATFLMRDDALWLRDEGAAGGVFIRLRGLTVPIRPGSLFAVGDRLLRFAGPLPPPPPPGSDGTRRVGAPRPEGAAVLVEEWLEGGVGGRTFLRCGPSVTIGRAGCAINLGDDPYLSQAHAEILVDAAGAARLRDLGSSNGTFVRIPPGSERELHDGDAVRLGREVLRVEVG